MASLINSNQHSGYKQGVELKTEEGLGADGVNVITLLIKHLPEAIPQDTLYRLLSHYGASAVRSCFYALR